MTPRTEPRIHRRLPRYPTVRDIMTREVVVIEPTTPFKAIVETLLKHDIDGVPVLDIGDQLVGVVTEADLLSHESYGPQQARNLSDLLPVEYRPDGKWIAKAEGVTAEELMTRNPAVCRPDEDARAAARRMLRDHRKQLPVVEDSRVVGIVARRDFLRMFNRSDEEIRVDVGEALADHELLPEATNVTATVDDGVVHLGGTVGFAGDTTVIRAVLGGIHGVVGIVGEPVAVH